MVVGKPHEFVHGFGGGVSPAAVRGGAHQAVIVFNERHFDTLAVHLGSGGNEHLASVAVGGGQDGFRAHDVGGDGAYRVLDDQLHADRGGEVDNDIGLAGQTVQHLAVHDVFAHELVVGQRAQVLDILQPPG